MLFPGKEPDFTSGFIAPWLRGVKGTRSCLQMASMAGRAVIGPEGSPPPGITHWPTIKKWRNPGSVFGNGLNLVPGAMNQPSMLPFQLPV